MTLYDFREFYILRENQAKTNISIILGRRQALQGGNFARGFTSARPNRVGTDVCAAKERNTRSTKEIPVTLRPGRHFPVVGMSTTTPILSLSLLFSPRRNGKEVVGWKMATPRGKGLPTATQREITFPQSAPQTFLRSIFSPLYTILRFSHMHPPATAAAVESGASMQELR